MSEKAILFSTPMVQAILGGRKTQTRRVVKPQPTGSECYGICTDSTANKKDIGKIGFGEGETTEFCKPCYQVGDVLWVRETWMLMEPQNNEGPPFYLYKADKPAYESSPWFSKWRPSIHMPRAAARIFLRVTEVRMEQLQTITRNDCMAEDIYDSLYLHAYSRLWDSLNTRNGNPLWKNNPWVWVISFERVEA